MTGYDPPLLSMESEIAELRATEPSRDPLAITGFVLATTSFGLALLGVLAGLGIVLGLSAIPGLVFSSIAYNRRERYSGKTLMLWGFWINLTMVVLFVLLIVLLFIVLAQAGGSAGGGSAA